MSSKRPSPFQVDHVRVRVHSGPRADGRWRWRAEKADGHGGALTIWSGWGTRDEAGEAVREKLAQGDQPKGELVTVRDLLECWVAAQNARLDVADLTKKSCKLSGDRLVEHTLADVPLATLARRDLERHRDAALAAGVSGATVRRDLKYLRQAWAWGLECEQIKPSRVLPRVKVERIKPVRTRYTPTLEDVVALLQGHSPEVWRGLVLLAATGCRASEITELRWKQVPFDARHIRVDGKTGEREVALHKTVAAEVRSWERGRPDDLVVGRTGQALRVALAKRAEQLGLPRVSPNGLRRHVVDALYRTGRIDAAASQMGHSAQTALEFYRQVSAQDRKRAIEEAELGVLVELDRGQARKRGSQ